MVLFENWVKKSVLKLSNKGQPRYHSKIKISTSRNKTYNDLKIEKFLFTHHPKK